MALISVYPEQPVTKKKHPDVTQGVSAAVEVSRAVSPFWLGWLFAQGAGHIFAAANPGVNTKTKRA